MGKLEKSIKSEMVRLARMELRNVSVPLVRDVWSLKRAISQIRKNVLPLQRFIARQQKELENRKIPLEVTPEEMKISRFSPRLIQSLRKHLGYKPERIRDFDRYYRRSCSKVGEWEV